MLKLTKIFLTLITFVLIALLTAPFFIDVNDYKPEIKAAVFDATGRNLSIDHIELSLIPWVGLTLKDARLDNADEFEQPYVLSVKSVDIKVALFPLLFSQKAEIKKFALNEPTIWLTQKEDGTNNWSEDEPLPIPEGVITDIYADIAPVVVEPKPKPTPTPQKVQNTPVALNAKLLELNDGKIIWNDQAKGQVVLSSIQLKIRDLQLKQPVGFELSAQLDKDTISLQGEIGPLRNLNTFDIFKAPIIAELNSSNISLAPLAPWLPELSPEQSQKIGHLADTNISLNISFEQHEDGMILSSGEFNAQNKKAIQTSWKLNIKSLKTLKVESFHLNIDGHEAVKISGKIRNLDKKPRFEARIETPKLQRIWLNSFVPNLQNIYRSHSNPWQSIKLAAFVAGDADILEIRNLQLELDNEPLQLSGDVLWGEAPDIQLRLMAKELHLDPWIPQGSKNTRVQQQYPEIDASGQPKKQKEKEPNLTFLRPWYVSIQLNAQRVHLMKLKLDKLRMSLSIEKGIVRLDPLRFDIEGGHVVENFTMYTNQYPVTWKESMKVNNVSIQPILKALADFSKLSGTTQLKTDLSGKGLLPKTIIYSLKGRGNFLFENGQFKGVDIAKAARKLTKQPSAQNATDFAQMQGSFYIKNAVLNNNDLYMASPLFRMSGKGKLFLDPMTLDYHVRPRLVQTLAGQGGSINKKGVVIPLRIQGPVSNPSISTEMDKKAALESAAAINEAAGNKVGGLGGKVLDQGFTKTRDEQKDKLVDKTKEKLKDALKGFKF